MPEAAVAVTVGEAVRSGAARLADAGCDTPRLDAELLLASVLGVSRGRLVVDAGAELEAGAARSFSELLARRMQREPVAYILGFKEFRRISLAVDSRVLIPRPDTELLVEVGLELPGGARVLDVGTGSGAIALALKDERPDLEVVGVDVDPDVVALARANAERLGLDVRFVVGDVLAGLQADAVLANLPYVAEGASLAPEIRRYEPARALFAGDDGLDVIRRLLAVLDVVPLVGLEIGFDQADAVAALVAGAGYAEVERRRDLAGYERVVVGRR